MRPIPFSVVAPATIIFFGASVALATTFFGLRDLENRAQEAAEFKASLLVRSFSKRLEESRPSRFRTLIENAAARSECTLLVVDQQDIVHFAAPSQPLSENDLAKLKAGKGVFNINQHAIHFAVAEIPGGTSRLVALAPVGETAEAGASLVSSVATFAALLLAAAGFVGWALARDVHADVLYVGKRIASMAQSRAPSQVSAVPVRTIDQVGQLTASFNMLMERFHAAERAYHQDLSQAKDFAQDRAAFLSALSHELRTPLNAILGFADVLLDEIDGPLSEESRENLTIVRTSGEHLRSLIDDILALSALESGSFRLSRERLQLSSVARDVVTEARVTAAQKGIQIELSVPEGDESTTAFADKRRMRQILQNVVSNAVKFTNVGSVVVKLVRHGDTIITTVSDTGPGIAREQLEAIFEEFRQADSSNAQRQGTGLGLSITRRLVHMHGGSVRAESEVGSGSTFSIRIPVDEATARQKLPSISAEQNTVIRELES